MRYYGDDIYKVIPNRKPLMILDYIDVNNGVYSEGRVTLTENMWFFECHYPNNPIFPICLLIESMAQVFSAIFFSDSGEIPVVYSLGPVKMSGGATVGDVIKFTAVLKKRRRGVISGECYAYKIVDGKEDYLPVWKLQM